MTTEKWIAGQHYLEDVDAHSPLAYLDAMPIHPAVWIKLAADCMIALGAAVLIGCVIAAAFHI